MKLLLSGEKLTVTWHVIKQFETTHPNNLSMNNLAIGGETQNIVIDLPTAGPDQKYTI